MPCPARPPNFDSQDTVSNASGRSHSIILRHQDGDAWDYCAIEHIGTKATVEIPATPMPASARSLMQRHDDTFVSGPPWAEFAKQMGIDNDTAKTTGSVYVVSIYRAAPGQFDALEKMLGEPPNSAVDTSSGNILMQHLEGGPWNFLAVARYDSWQKFAMVNEVAQHCPTTRSKAVGSSSANTSLSTTIR